MDVAHNGKKEREGKGERNNLKTKKHLTGKFLPRSQFTICWDPETHDDFPFKAEFVFYFC